MKPTDFLKRAMAVALILALAPRALGATRYKYRILYTFTGGGDGGWPASGLVFDSTGNPYGATYSGGTLNTDCPFQGGCGVIFELSPQKNGHWKENVLFNFVKDTGGEPKNAQPLLVDNAGNLFGNTAALEPGSPAYVFELTPGSGQWNFNPIYALGGGCLVLDQKGDLYGCIGDGKYDHGAIGELSPGSNGWTYTDLYDFCKLGCRDGIQPESPLSWDQQGILYGTTLQGGNGYGVAFRMTPNGDGTWTYHVLHRFGAFKQDGLLPVAGLVVDAAGNAYGVTWAGGQYNDGTVFRLTPSTGGRWKETILWDFPPGVPGAGPLYTLALDHAGALYGMAQGGDKKCGPCGVIFKLAPQKSGKWKYSVLHTFHGPEGADPYGVILDGKGNIFGTTYDGGKYGAGVAFEITP